MSTGNSAIYFDTAATTRVAPEVCAAMLAQLDGSAGFANPASAQHEPGRLAAEVIEQARGEVAVELRCAADEILFTSGATESINLALRGVALANAHHGRHIVTTQIEHKATLACCDALAAEGFQITRIPPGADGRIDPDALARALREDTLIVSVMHTNNETGVLQPLREIAAIAEERGVLLHVDAAQAAGKMPIDLAATPIDLLSLSAHKFHGPKGIGCLFVRDRARLPLRPLAFGGGQEFGLRPGTVPTHQVVGLATALRLAAELRDRDHRHVSQLRTQLIDNLSTHMPLSVHGSAASASPYIVNLSIAGIGSDALINQCAPRISIASGSACSAGTVEPSHVLRAMGVDGDPLYGAVRISFDRYHTPDDVETAVDAIVHAVSRIRELDA
jgi:cysteine desulfurase